MAGKSQNYELIPGLHKKSATAFCANSKRAPWKCRKFLSTPLLWVFGASLYYGVRKSWWGWFPQFRLTCFVHMLGYLALPHFEQVSDKKFNGGWLVSNSWLYYLVFHEDYELLSHSRETYRPSSISKDRKTVHFPWLEWFLTFLSCKKGAPKTIAILVRMSRQTNAFLTDTPNIVWLNKTYFSGMIGVYRCIYNT